jgi:hypothetical protein
MTVRLFPITRRVAQECLGILGISEQSKADSLTLAMVQTTGAGMWFDSPQLYRYRSNVAYATSALFWSWESQGIAYAMCSPLANLAQYLAIGGAYDQDADPARFLGLNSYLYERSQEFLNYLKTVYLPGTPFRIFGHSLGGAMADALAYGMLLDGRFSVQRVVSMGGPRPGTAVVGVGLSTLDAYWIQVFNDRVPTIPPTQMDFTVQYPQGTSSIHLGAMMGINPELTFKDSWDTYFPPGPCVTLAANGEASLGGPLTVGRISLPAFFNINTTIMQPEHARDSYIEALNNYLVALNASVLTPQPPSGPPVVPMTTPINPVLVIGPPGQGFIDIPVVLTGPTLATGRPSYVVDPSTVYGLPTGIILKGSNMVPPQYQYKTIKIADGRYDVFLESERAAIFPTRSQARTFARKANSTLNYLLRSEGVDINGFTTGLAQWFADANNPVNGFMPPLIIAS